jgi:YD repeat-containing protein
MTRTSQTLRAGAWGALLLAGSASTAPALAQQLPRFDQVDANGVDLYTGGFSFSLVEGSIGSGVGEVALARNWVHGVGWTDNWSGVLYELTSGANTEAVVEFGRYSDRFTFSGGAYTSQKADGATLAAITSPVQGYLYTASDGTQITFRDRGTTGAYWIEGPACQRSTNGRCALPITIRQPTGMTYALTWDLVNICTGGFTWGVCNSGTSYPRFRGASSSANYSFTINYATDTPGSGAPVADWYVRATTQFTNLDSAPGTLPTVTYSGGGNPTSVSDIGGDTWQFAYSSGILTGIRRPGAGANTTTIGYSNGTVSYVTREGVSTTYDRYTSGTGGLMTVTDADSHQTLISLNLTKERITSIFDPLERTTALAYDSNGRLTNIGMPGGTSVGYTYDARGNITARHLVDRAVSGVHGADLVTSASYPSSCSNPVTCNLPTSTTDARGHTTDYTYNSTHGGAETVTAPAPSGSGDRPRGSPTRR